MLSTNVNNLPRFKSQSCRIGVAHRTDARRRRARFRTSTTAALRRDSPGAAAHIVQNISKVHMDSLERTGRELGKHSSVRGLLERGRRDVERVKQAHAPLSQYSEVWTPPVCLVIFSTLSIAWASELAGSPYSSSFCGAVGALVGFTFALAHRAATVRFWVEPRRNLNVVITGGTRGIGRALVREFLAAGDNVFIAARSAKCVRETSAELASECVRPRQISGVDCDVSKPSSVSRLTSRAQNHFGTIDVWINNAGVSGSFKPFADASAADLQAVTKTNLLGALLCTRAAILSMTSTASQKRRGHIFNMDGAGADGAATANYAAYGATKAGIAHLMATLTAECKEADLDVGVHTLSPGMVLTDLLLEGATPRNKQVFNVLCEQPETAAAFLVPRVRTVVARAEPMAYIRVLTTGKALEKLLTAPFRPSRFFSQDGSPNYLQDDSERIDGRGAKKTARALSSSRRRGNNLQMLYASCLCVCVLALSVGPSVSLAPFMLPSSLSFLPH